MAQMVMQRVQARVAADELTAHVDEPPPPSLESAEESAAGFEEPASSVRRTGDRRRLTSPAQLRTRIRLATLNWVPLTVQARRHSASAASAPPRRARPAPAARSYGPRPRGSGAAGPPDPDRRHWDRPVPTPAPISHATAGLTVELYPALRRRSPPRCRGRSSGRSRRRPVPPAPIRHRPRPGARARGRSVSRRPPPAPATQPGATARREPAIVPAQAHSPCSSPAPQRARSRPCRYGRLLARRCRAG